MSFPQTRGMSTLSTTFVCGELTITVTTTQIKGESDADFAARHRQNVQNAKDDCTDSSQALGPIQTSWTADLGEMTYASEADYGQAAHDADVVSLRELFQ